MRGNRLAVLPSGLGGCSALVECDLRDNLLTELPASLGRLPSLKILLCDNNRRAGCGGLPWLALYC